MPDEVQFCILGPLVVRRDGVALPIAHGKQRALLAVLLLRAGRAIAADELAELLWPAAAPPPSASVTVRNYVKRLRHALASAGQDRIITQPGGYLIRVEPGELDVSLMEQSLAKAHDAARGSAWEQTAVHARAALDLWRDEPLSDVNVPQLAAIEVPRLMELRLQARELSAEAAIQLGQHAEAATELRQLTAANPFREHLHALLMLSLYRCGRRGEALDAYRNARGVLVEGLGSEPGPELQAVHQQILRDDPALASPSTSVTQPARSRAAARGRNGTLRSGVPRQLPVAVRGFTGRDAELAFLTGLLDTRAVQTEPSMLITAIDGGAGVGKTALAIRWAHQVADRFPDGQLYVNLRGYDPEEPLAAGDALAGFLRALGVPGQGIPDGLEDRARLYRSRLAGRRVLVVLDNARDAEHVRPLLPGDACCVTLVTSRDALAGLAATDGARRLDLDLLPLGDAVGLLRSLIGERADSDPAAAVALAGLCARLPLALRIAAELAVARPAVPLVDLAAELAADRLDGLDAGEDRADVRAVFSWSLRLLPENAAEMFVLIGLHPGDDLDVLATAALAGTTADQARRGLGQLHRAGLLQGARPGRYGMHDLLRAYAREQAAARDADGRCHRAQTRLFDYYLAAAAAAMDVLFPSEAHWRPRVQPAASAIPGMPGEAEARAWLDRERANLVTIVVHCARHGWPRHATDLAGTLFRYVLTGSHLPEADTIQRQALQAARLSGDLAAEADALNGLGGIGILKGHFRDAAGHFRAALERYGRCGDQAGQARVLHNLGVTEQWLYDPRSAAGYFRRAVAGFEGAGQSVGAALALADLADAEADLGDYGEAAEHLERALPVLHGAEHQLGEAQALARIGSLNLRRGQATEAADFYGQALAIFRRIDHPTGVASALLNLGEVSRYQGEYQHAIGYLRQALAMYRTAGGQYGETVTLRSLAGALHGAGETAAARAELAEALRLAAETGNTYQQARAHQDLADSHHAAGQDEQAGQHWRQALTLYTVIGAPEADQIRSRLSAGGGATAQR
jgi:DNA-binding SARP family transcriptional activator